MYVCMYVCKSQLVRYPNRETMVNNENNDVLLYSVTNEEETPYEQLPHH